MNFQSPNTQYRGEAVPVEPSVDLDCKPLETLVDMLTYRRVSGSRTEGKFIRRFIAPLGARPDSFGNYVLRIADSPVLFSSHTDSVHRIAGRQKLLYKDGILTVKTGGYQKKEGIWRLVGSNCLGADDGVGCWIMREMALAKVPGLYIWHRQEESGGVGSSFIADHSKDLLTGIECAIAFDRHGTTDVITHQAGGRCCSNEFAESLAGLLPGSYKPSMNGIFTDTANYTDVIGECTNLSVGYEDEHTSKESLNLVHALRLRDAMVKFDPASLDYQRKPGTREPTRYYHGYGSYGGYEDIWDDVDQNPSYGNGEAYGGDNPSWRHNHGAGSVNADDDNELFNTRSDFDAMVEMIRLNPRETADLLETWCGMDAKTLRKELLERGASVHRV